MEGCDLFCSFCIVPLTRGREASRPAEAILREARTLAARGVREITLLGQTVNAYGRHDLRRGRGEAAGTLGFAALLSALAAIPGLARLRYTSPHPSFFDDALIRAHAELPALCPHVHLPLQSGSDAVLARMRRRYRADDYRRLVERLRAARPDLALTTDLIVGFPGETDRDFEATLALVRELRFVDAFSFKYSPRPGTAAASAPDPVPAEVASQRLEALQQLQREATLDAHRARVGGIAEVLVEGPSRRGGGQGTGRDAYHRVVNFAVTPEGGPAPGELVWLRLVEATPHSLIGEPLAAGSPAAGAVKRGLALADESGRSGVLGA
jgi:tRNA-2-methylthio-N6-dimethylallyladenosine synthase